ncbi:E3 ubiquitin-protein ligase MGRN1 isoform X4 [Hydra vulgaris]|uniref:RING-type E3 ubiquitin transferase n=1 Tax=Hydra vulgaris TaxID=6087 RepID=A0ABM4CET5_HYDVU
MGNYLPYFNRRTDNGVEIINANAVYRFPPKSGSYFGTHFMMAGEKFENMNPERFLFGENSDLNYLPTKPMPFPYSIGKSNEPSNTVRSLVHLRKDTLKLLKISSQYWIEFVFDTDIACSVDVYLMANEFLTTDSLKYASRKPELSTEPVKFGKGANQVFRTCLLIDPEDFQPSELNYIPGNNEIPLVIQISVDDIDFPGQSEATLAGIEKLSEGIFTIKFMKQKIMVDGFCFITQEIYGIENKSGELNEFDGDDVDDNIECVICMNNLRNTIMLPCRHLCLCETCGEQMRTSSSRCPICRANFNALLQIKAVRKKKYPPGSIYAGDDQLEEVDLIEALNGFNPETEEDCNSQISFSRQRCSLSSKGRRSFGRSRSARSFCTENKNRASGRSYKSASMISNQDTEDLFLEKEVIPEFPPEAFEQTDKYIDASLPGTPIESKDYNESAASKSSSSQRNRVPVFNESCSSHTHAQITTPSEVVMDEKEPRSSVCVRYANKKKFDDVYYNKSDLLEDT